MEKRLTIFILSMNRPVYLKRALESVLVEDNSSDIEIVVSVNKSMDVYQANYLDLVNLFQSRVKFIFRPTLLSVGDHLTTIISEVKTEYMMFLADDDGHLNQFAKAGLELGIKQNVGLVFGDYLKKYPHREYAVSKDYTGDTSLARALKYVREQDDGCFYGLFKVTAIRSNLKYLKPYNYFGEQLLIHWVYPFLFSIIVRDGYAHLKGTGPVWDNDETTVKSQSYTSNRQFLHSFLSALVAKFVRQFRYQKIVFAEVGVLAGIKFLPTNTFVLSKILIRETASAGLAYLKSSKIF